MNICKFCQIEFGAVHKRVSLVELETAENETFIGKFGGDKAESKPSRLWFTDRPPPPRPLGSTKQL